MANNNNNTIANFAENFIEKKGYIATINFIDSIVQENRYKLEVYSEKGFEYNTYTSFEEAMKDFLTLSKHQENNIDKTLEYRSNTLSRIVKVKRTI